MEKTLKNFQIRSDFLITDALKKINEGAEKILFVVDENSKLLGTLTDGDVRRWILKKGSLDVSIEQVYNKSPLILNRDYDIDTAKKLMIKNRIEQIPVIDENRYILDILFWENIFSDKFHKAIPKLDVPIVIMAGGKGRRLEPFSKILPKPLIPIGEKPIIEIIIDEFREYGINEYYLTLNYKGKMIEAYFDNIEKDYTVNYVWENGYFGTASSLKLLENKISDIFIVSNCDVIVKADFGEVIELHKKEKALLTVLSSMQHHKIPYGVIKFEKGGKVTDILEKPEYIFTINTGVYILSRESLQFIPENSYFDMTDLIKRLIENDKKIITYPINEKNYIDTGQWEEYKRAIEKLEILEES